MSFRLYLVPQIGTGIFPDGRRPKYFVDDLAVPWVGMDYGFQPVYLVGADLSPTDDTFVIGQADVFGFPFDLDPQLTAGQANVAEAALELFFIPANWVTASLTWRDVARTTAGMFQYMQRLNVIVGNVILLDGTSNRTLNTQWQNVPVNIQTGIRLAASQLGYNTTFIANNTQVRAIFKNFSDQWGSKPFIFGGPWGTVSI